MEKKQTSKARKKKDEVSFDETIEGKKYVDFVLTWTQSPFHKDYPNIDLLKLWHSLTAYSEQGNKYKNWMAAARTFYLRNTSQYFKFNGESTKQADTKLIKSAESNIDTAKNNRDRIFGQD
jgi:hypothetical protein